MVRASRILAASAGFVACSLGIALTVGAHVVHRLPPFCSSEGVAAAQPDDFGPRIARARPAAHNTMVGGDALSLRMFAPSGDMFGVAAMLVVSTMFRCRHQYEYI